MSVTKRFGETLDRKNAGTRRALVFFNARAGSVHAGSLRALENTFAEAGWRWVIHQIAAGDDLSGIVEEARRVGVDLVVAAGGDGTVAAVGGCLVGSDVPLGIVPLGTGNVVAQELGIPLVPDDAAALLVGERDVRRIDAMRIGGRHYFLQAGVGLDALAMRDTTPESKRRLGTMAYVLTLLDKLRAHDAVRFTVDVDGHRHHVRGWAALAVNVGTLGWRAFRWGDEVEPADGVLDLVVVRARRPWDYLSMLWRLIWHRGRIGPALRFYQVRSRAAIRADRPLPVQADGDVIGETTLRVEVVPGAVAVVVPPVPEIVAACATGESRSRLACWVADAAVADAEAYLAINRLPHPPAFSLLMHAASELGSKGAIWTIGLLIAAWVNPRRYRPVLRDTLPPLALAGLAVEFPLKKIFRRPRPFETIEDAITTGRRPRHHSFPSAHAAVAFGAAWLLSRHLPRLRTALYAFAALVGISRVYLGFHYPSDVIVGTATGLGLAAAFQKLLARAGWSRPA